MRIENIDITIQDKKVARGTFEFFDKGVIKIPSGFFPCGSAILAQDILTGNFLMVNHDHHRQGWEIPAGGMENGETPAKCAERELFEETEAQAQVPKGSALMAIGILTWQQYHWTKKIFFSKPIKNELKRYQKKGATVWFYAPVMPAAGKDYRPSQNEHSVIAVKTVHFDRLANEHNKEPFDPRRIFEALKWISSNA